MSRHSLVAKAALLWSVLFCVFGILANAALAEKPAPRPAWKTSRLQGSPYTPAPYRIVPAFPGVRFELPTSLEEIPGANQLLVTEIGGKVFRFAKQRDVRAKQLLIDLAQVSGGEVKLFDAECHPRFVENHAVYLCYVHTVAKETRVSRFTLSGKHLDAASETVVITWPSGGHNGGCLEFGKDGYLYISTGDGSGPNPPDGLTTGQDVSDLLGAVLRLNVDASPQGRNYAIPSDNPFVGKENARAEIWAYGLRNPWKLGVDPLNGNVFVADNGWETWEMVHRIVRGGNCGWPVMEARAKLRTEVPVGPTPIIPPVKDHPHTEANSVIGGPVYRGDKLPGLNGTFVYGDYITGTIWGLRTDDQDYQHRTLVDTDQRITAFTQGTAGELFVLDYDLTGQVYELLPSDLEDTSKTFPRRLSETGLFKSLREMQPADGVVAYDVKSERWTDGFRAQRFVAIPGNGSIQLGDGQQPATYPDGTVFVKHLVRPASAGGTGRAIPAETQLLHYENGRWQPYTYAWNNLVQGDEPYDAVLVDRAGADRQVVYGLDPRQQLQSQSWHFNAENECRLCHNAASGYVLGFNSHQLEGAVQRSATQHVSDQLATLAAEKTITAAARIAKDDPARLVDPTDTTQSLDDRARSYLHANCSACHHPGGNAIVSFYLRRELPFDKLNTNKGTGIGTFGMRNAKLIVPGDPYRSVLFYRMSKLGYGRMPYIGSRVVDSQGIALIEQWIRNLPHESSDQDSALVRGDSREARLLSQAIAGKQDLSQASAGPMSLLLQSTEGSLALAAAVHAGRVPSGGAQAVYKKSPGDIRGLFETFVPEEARRKTLGPRPQPEQILTLDGDVARGKLIFFSDGARCRACHEVDDQAKSLGTTLRQINRKYPRQSEFLQHILQPSLKVDEAFRAVSIVTVDGQIITGLISEQTDQQVVIQTADRKRIALPKTEIEVMRKSDKSLMPENILSDLTAQEAADLLVYIRSLGASDKP